MRALGFVPPAGTPNSPGEHVIAEQLGRRAVEGGSLQVVPGRPDAQVHVGVGGVQLERPPGHLLTQQRHGLRQRQAGGDRGAWLEVQAGHAEGDAQDPVVALAGNRHPARTHSRVVFAFSARSSWWP